MLFRTLVLRVASLGFIKGLVTRSSLLHPLVFRFIAGETLDQAIKAAEDLAEKGLMSSLDLLGENVATLAEAKASADAYIEIIERIASSPHRSKINISIKLTALGLDQGMDVAEENYRHVLSAAAVHGIFVRADMESSDYTERTLELVERVFADLPNTGTVLQSCLRRTDEDIERLLRLGCRMRLVKGAYLEPPDRAYQDKGEVDFHYVKGAKNLMKEGNYPAIATHDEAIIGELKAYAKAEGLTNDRFEWQMLYGIRRDLQESLVAEGANVRVYIPYGAQWYPYFSRRLAERPANLFFIARSILKK
jgi:proline dehydrogenase